MRETPQRLPGADFIAQQAFAPRVSVNLSGYLTTVAAAALYQPVDADLTAIAALSPSNDDIIQRKAGAWTNRTMAQLAADIPVASLSGTKANFDAACSDGNFAYASDLASYQPLDADLTALAGVTSAADKVPYFTGSGTASVADFSSVGRTLVGQTTQALMRSTGLGLGTSAVVDTGTSGTKVPLLDGANTWSGVQTFAAGTVTAPSIRFATAGNGFYDAGGAFYFAQAGVSRMTLGDGLAITSNTAFKATSGTSTASSSADTSMSRAGASNSWAFCDGGSGSGQAVSRAELNKKVSSIADNTATDVLTVTIPNAAHSGQLYIELCGSLGAGGAVGANEATAVNCYTVAFTRTAGVNAVATISAASGAAACAVAGAATATCTGTLSAVTGAAGASNSFTVKATIARSGGSSANHTCLVYAKLMNANASGITIS